MASDDPETDPAIAKPIAARASESGEAAIGEAQPAPSGDLHPSEVGALAGDTGAVGAERLREAGTPAIDPTRTLPPVQLAAHDHRGRTITARLSIVEGDRGGEVRIDLEPADLGRVEVALRLDDAGTAVANFVVDRPETLQLLQRDARTVADMLGAAGFAVDDGAVGFSLRDPASGHGGADFRQPADRKHGPGPNGAPGNSAPARRLRLLDLEV